MCDWMYYEEPRKSRAAAKRQVPDPDIETAKEEEQKPVILTA
jgi:hypothetical protein